MQPLIFEREAEILLRGPKGGPLLFERTKRVIQMGDVESEPQSFKFRIGPIGAGADVGLYERESWGQGA